MGTRAVVHVDLNPVGYEKDIWIATHWDGNPESLGADLKKAIAKEIYTAKKKGSAFVSNMGGILQKAVWKGSADHHIDASSVNNKREFDELYDDFAEYEYDISPKGKIKVRKRKGTWSENRAGEWKKLSQVL